ncbi:aminotransferase class V-fold PLP-dependent enzyme [Ancylobacter terrae]|uniref:aminotransferase class V-fold PLP-dependent enzyme n=1 Tax=Ancylobacter sp. sgz301288 TaxID=3342077 RepID=UPI00385F808F
MGGDIMARRGLTALLNASGTETVYGASRVPPEIIAEIADILAVSVEMAELQALASRIIADATGAEAGYVTNCSSASIVIAAAAAMTGDDRARAEQLPDTSGMRDEIVLQRGHVVNYGSLITGDLRLSGARPVEIGAATDAATYQMRAALGPRTAAALYVISHHTTPTGMIPLDVFIAEVHAAGVPVIVDAAAEYGWPDVIGAGADLVLFSVQKALGGPTAGIIAGRADLVAACATQRFGVGRPMKAGKEAVIGAIAALERWRARDHAAEQAAVCARAGALAARLDGLSGLRATVVPDETGNPFSRTVLTIDPAVAGFDASELAKGIEDGAPRVLVRTLLAERGVLLVDVRRLDAGELDLVAARVRGAVERLQGRRRT